MTLSIYVPGTEERDLKKVIMSLQNLAGNITDGIWTPALTFTTPGDFSATYSVATGFYSKRFNTVEIWYQITTSAFTYTTAAGTLRITGLPFTAAVWSGANWRGLVRFGGFNKAGYSQINTTVLPGTAQAQFGASGMGVAPSQIDAADVPTASSLNLSGWCSFQI